LSVSTLCLLVVGVFLTPPAQVLAGKGDMIFDLEDPLGDDYGDGSLVYPLSTDFEEGDLDVVRVRAYAESDVTRFEVEFAEPIRAPQRGAIDDLGTDMTRVARHGFYTFNVDIYIDEDRVPLSGSTPMLPGRKAEVRPEDAWERAVCLTPTPVEARSSLRRLAVKTLESREYRVTPEGVEYAADSLRTAFPTDIDSRVYFPTKIRARKRKISFEVPHEFLGGSAKDSWSYVVVVTGADLSQSLGVGARLGLSESDAENLMALPISPGVWQERFGGGRANEPLQPPIVDMLVPRGQKQEWVLANFNSRAGRPAMLPGVVPADESRAAPAGEPVSPEAGDDAVQWQLADVAGEVFYEIFVRSFADSDSDGVGDLRGLISRLDYLNDGDPETTEDLGIDGVWLMPVFESPSYHGYDVTNYLRINPEYGTDADLDSLLAETHRRGIKVVLDLMINHTSNQHPWFIESAPSPTSPRRGWYVWRADDPGWTQPWGGSYHTWHPLGDGWYYYGIFSSRMPDLNFRTRDVRDEVEQIAEYWLSRGVDGFRLDAARHIMADGPGDLQNDTPGTHDFWREFCGYVRTHRPAALLVGEVWSDAPTIASYYGSTDAVRAGDEFPMTFDFPLAGSIIQAVGSGDASGIRTALGDIASHYPTGVLDATFLTNHDMVRVATQLDGDVARMRMAASILLTLPGTPFIYYGEEVGVSNGRTRGDESKRTPMPWDSTADGGFTTGRPWFALAPGHEEANVASQTNDTGSLLSHYRRLIRVRKALAALRSGTLELLVPAQESPSVLAFVRRAGDSSVLVVHNLGDDPAETMLSGLHASGFAALYADAGVGNPAGEPGAWRVAMPPRTTGVWLIR
jgi:alpha-amylase